MNKSLRRKGKLKVAIHQSPIWYFNINDGISYHRIGNHFNKITQSGLIQEVTEAVGRDPDEIIFDGLKIK